MPVSLLTLWKRRRYLRSTHADIRRLPLDLRTSARVLDQGEAKWPEGYAERVINALADQQIVLHVLEAEPHVGDGEYAVSTITLYEPDGHDDVERSRHRLLEGTRHLQAGQSPIITRFTGTERSGHS